MVVNGSFESDDLSKWEIISWAGQTMKIEEEVQTGIAHVAADAPEGTDTRLYDLMGRRVNPAALRPGIYIRDGKKIVLK